MDLTKFLSWFDKNRASSEDSSNVATAAPKPIQPENDNPNGVAIPVDANEIVRLKTELMGQLSALHNAAIVSETDLQGNITFANDMFYKFCKYSPEELIGRNHRILKSGHQPDEIFVELWQTISRGKVWAGEVKNKAKDGSYYWVWATITPILDLETKRPIKYVSVRFDITQQKLHEEELEVKNKEINQLLERLQQAQQQLEEQFIEKSSALEESVTYAMRIQHTMLPSPPTLKSIIPEPFEISVFFQPREQVSGDFYWVGQRKNRTVLALGDSTGHGVPGAFLSLVGITTLNKLVQDRGITDPSHLLDEMDSEIRAALKQDQSDNDDMIQDSIEMAVCSFIPHKSEIQFAAAMRKSYLVKTNGDCIEISADRRPVGGTLYGNDPFNIQTLNMSSGEVLFMFSDGFMTQLTNIPQPDGRSRKFGAKAFREMLVEAAKLNNLDDCVVMFKQSLNEWRGLGNPQTDDILILALRHK
jgi:PAS domain S-box-containing protein